MMRKIFNGLLVLPLYLGASVAVSQDDMGDYEAPEPVVDDAAPIEQEPVDVSEPTGDDSY